MNEQSLGLVKEVFHWAREVDPAQPLTMGVWYGNEALNEFQLSSSDIITFHDYNPLDYLVNTILKLKKLDRPIVCTEYMARTRGSRFETHLPVFKSERVGCINWGLVAGKTQTYLPWASETGTSDEWFHEIFYEDGTPYLESEIEAIRAAADLI